MVAGLVWISGAQKTRTIPGWHLPVTIEVTRDAEVIYYDPDAALPPTTFDFEFPEGTTLLY